MIALVVVTWLAAFACCHQLARIAGCSTTASRVVCASALSAAVLSVLPGQLTRLTHNFPVSIAIACTLFVAASLGLRRVPANAISLPDFVKPHWIAFVVGAIAFVCVIDGALTRNFFDEDHHVPMLTVIARGVVPPRHPLDPGETIPYHWGIDSLYAQLFAGGLRPDRAIDVVTILCWPLLFFTSAWLGGALRGKIGATLGAIVIPLSGSALAWPLHDDMGILQLPQPWPESWHQWDRRPPPITADYFQHPQGLAFSLVVVTLVVFILGKSRPTLAVSALLLACLSLVQSVHFLVVGFALTAHTIAAFLRDRDVRASIERVVALACALALAVLFGGFFDVSAPTASTLLWGRSFFADANVIERVLHHVVVFGVPLVLLPFVKNAMRVALIAGASIGFLMPNVVVYASSWDIVKLYSAGAFLAGIACADTLARFIATKRAETASRAHIAIVATSIAAVAFTVWFPIAWMASRTVMQGHLGVPEKHDFRLRDDVLDAGRAFSPLIPATARVLTSDAEMARQNGFLAPGFDARRYLPFHMVDYNKARTLLTAHDVGVRTFDAASIETLDVDYAIVPSAWKNPLNLEPIAKTAKWSLFKLPRSTASVSASAP